MNRDDKYYIEQLIDAAIKPLIARIVELETIIGPPIEPKEGE